MKSYILAFLLACATAFAQSDSSLVGHADLNGTVDVGPLSTGSVLLSVSVNPVSVVQQVGSFVSFAAIGTFSGGLTQDVTAQASWSDFGTAANCVVNAGVCTNTFQCNSLGIVTIVANVAGIQGMASLTCQALSINPTGTLTAFQSQLFSQLFTAFGGTPPYVFSSIDLPSWLALTSTGCGLTQIDCNLTGTQASVGTYNFHITATDSGANTLTVPISVQVVAVGTEDNRYCNPNGTTTVAGQMDGPANMIQQCVYDAIANTPAVCIAPLCTVPTLFVCPPTQVDGSGHLIAGCANHTPPFYNTIQAALNALTACGQQIQVYSKNGFPSASQNVYDETLLVPGLSCGPVVTANNPHAEWVWITTVDFASLPNPGTRINPAWAGQNAITGYPSYTGPSNPGIYVPFVNPSLATCEAETPNGCAIITVGGNGAVPSGFRFMGLELAWTKTHQTAPGFFGAQVQSGCSTDDCPQGASYIIFDRMIFHACQDKNDLTCTDAAPVGVQLVNGNYQAVINSYFYGFKTIGDNRGFLGPQDESHGISGGNIQGTCNDGPNKVVNNFLGVASQPFFWGGASSDPATATCTDGSHSYDLEFRRNSLFRPLTYMVGPYNPENNFAGGKIFDAWVGKAGASYSAPVCSVEASPQDNGTNGATALCAVTVLAGKITDITILNQGFGYTKANPKITLTDPTGAGATLFPEDGIYIIKNDGEEKHAVRVLFEGNVATHLWTGQSDESATCWLMRATDDITLKGNENCPNCRVNDVVMRYNVCRDAATGVSIGVQQATRGGTIAESTGFVSVHDNIFELSAMWITATGLYSSGGTLVDLTNNGQPGTQALQSIKLNHNTVLHAEPSNFSQQATGASFMTLLTALCGKSGKTNTTAVWNSITIENTIGGGGVKNISLKSNGCFFTCQRSNTCNSTLALNSKLTNVGLDPVSGGFYTTNEVTGVSLTDAGAYTVPPTTCTITNPTGTGATCGLIFDETGALSGLSLSAFGQNYANAPSSTTLTIGGGTFTRQATGTAFIGGSGNPSPSGAWCADHNINIVAGWPGEDAMLPDPTTQGDIAAQNSCFFPAGGHWIDVNTNNDVKFTNMNYNLSNNIPVDWGWPGFTETDDLHLLTASQGHNAANGDNQGRDVANGGPTLNDIGADVDLVLLYTGCTISSGRMICP